MVQASYIGCFIDAEDQDMGNPDLPRDQRGGHPEQIVLGASVGADWAYDLGEAQPQFSSDELAEGLGRQFCAEYCSGLGYSYMGMQWTDACWCGEKSTPLL